MGGLSPEYRKIIEKIAAIAHYGALIEYENIYDAMNEIRRLSLPFWDKTECEYLQCKGGKWRSDPPKQRRN